MNEKLAENQAELIFFLGTKHPHLSFKDIFAISETIINVVEESKKNK